MICRTGNDDCEHNMGCNEISKPGKDGVYYKENRREPLAQYLSGLERYWLAT